MSRSKRELSTDEQRLWRRVAATVKSKRKPPASEPADAAAAASAETAPRSPRKPSALVRAPASPPADRANEKRVRRGKLEIDATLDLHGHTQQSGRPALERFLRAARRRQHRVVVVITGAGRGGEGILRRKLPEWLAETDLRPLTSGYARAHRSHGGAGAFYVFIRRGRGSD